jgi:hypothetical protein
MDEYTIAYTRTLITRLERLSADSHYAYRASGVRRSLMNCLDRVEGGDPVSAGQLLKLSEYAFQLLSKAAAEKRGDELQRRNL